MNTNRDRKTWVRITRFVALASLATMGFSAANGGNHSMVVTADVGTCEPVETAYTALELLEFIDNPCYAVLLDSIEHEIDWGLSGQLSTAALMDSIYERLHDGSSSEIEYLELIEAETEMVPFSPVNLAELDRRLLRTWVTARSSPSKAGRSAGTSVLNRTPFASAWGAINLTEPWMWRPRSIILSTSSNFPASIFDRSRMSSMRLSRKWPLS